MPLALPLKLFGQVVIKVDKIDTIFLTVGSKRIFNLLIMGVMITNPVWIATYRNTQKIYVVPSNYIYSYSS